MACTFLTRCCPFEWRDLKMVVAVLMFACVAFSLFISLVFLIYNFEELTVIDDIILAMCIIYSFVSLIITIRIIEEDKNNYTRLV